MVSRSRQWASRLRLSDRQKNGFHRLRAEPSVFKPSGPMTSPTDQRGACFALSPFVPEDVRAHPPERWVDEADDSVIDDADMIENPDMVHFPEAAE